MFTKENAREMQVRGWRARMERTTPERRSLAAKRAAMARWYRPDGDPRQRIDCHLRFLAKMAALAMVENDRETALRAVIAMLPYERMKIALETAMKNLTPEPNDTKIPVNLITLFAETLDSGTS